LTGQPSSHRLLFRLRLALRRGEHPTPEMLAAYCADELTPEEDEKIREHFVDCRDCPELLLDFKDFSAPDRAVTERIPESWVAAAWQSLRARLAREPAPRLQLAYSLTGLLLAATLGLSAWVVSLQRELRQLREPQANVQIETLDLSTRGGSHAVRVPSGGERFLLSVATAADVAWRDCREIQVRLATEDGSELWTAGMPPPLDGTITLELSRRALPAGGYKIRFQGTGPSCRTAGEDFPFVLSYL
jgi:Putative zinc-finger